MKLAFGRVGFESHSNQIAVGFGNKVPFPKLIRRKLLFESNSTLKIPDNSAFENPLFMGGLCKCGKVFLPDFTYSIFLGFFLTK